jgi:hypothetical protein
MGSQEYFLNDDHSTHSGWYAYTRMSDSDEVNEFDFTIPGVVTMQSYYLCHLVPYSYCCCYSGYYCCSNSTT